MKNAPQTSDKKQKFQLGDKFVCTTEVMDSTRNCITHIKGNEYQCLAYTPNKGVDNAGIIKLTTEPGSLYIVFADMKHFHNRFKKIAKGLF